MAVRIVWSETANADLKKITFYIRAEWSEKSVQKFKKILFEKIETLKDNPTRGRKSTKSGGFRLLKIDNHNFVLYEFSGDMVKIHNVLPYLMDHSDDQRF